jgi:Putative beta-barrel porin 2
MSADNASRTRAIMAAAIVIVALTGRAPDARAQQPDVPTVGLGWRAGNLFIAPSVVLTSGYDSNVNREAPSIAARESYALPQLEVIWRTKHWLADATSTAEVTHMSGSEKGATNWRGAAALSYSGARVKPYVAYDRPRTYARPTGFEVGKRSVHLDDNLTAGVDIKATPRTVFGVKTVYDKTRWDADAEYAGSSLRETLNRNTMGATARVSYRLTALTSLTGSTDYSRFRFINAPARDADSQTAMVGLEFKSPGLLEGSASAGVLRFRSPTHSAPDFTGAVVDAGVGYARRSGAYTRIDVSRNLLFSYDPNRACFILLGVSLSYSRPIGPRWELVSFVGRHHIDYRTPASGVQPSGNRLTDAGVAVAYRVGRWTRIGASLDGFQQSGLIGYNGFRAVGFLHIGVGTPRRLDRPIPLER